MGAGSTRPPLCGHLAGMCGKRRRLGWTCEWGCTRAPCWGASSARNAGSTMCGPPTSPWPTRWRLAASRGECVFLPRVGTGTGAEGRDCPSHPSGLWSRQGTSGLGEPGLRTQEQLLFLGPVLPPPLLAMGLPGSEVPVAPAGRRSQWRSLLAVRVS